MSREGLGDDAYEQSRPGKARPPPPPSADPTRNKPSKTTATQQFALRPGDDVDLSSERGTTLAGSIEQGSFFSSKDAKHNLIKSLLFASKKSLSLLNFIGPIDKPQPQSKPKQKPEKEKRAEAPLKSIVLDIKPYKEPTLLKFCHAITLLLLVLSFALMALTVVQFVDIFVWLPMLMGEKD
ncbi:hypothetical protein ANCCAN_19996 [Ancylostoma caninum]|uniref:Uncharacterized protein n=1 Tax=Ancylostoma caninum TaxID=29170 RepID=A0A368FPJ7_ANCCA|nr:hypothetical protein ANCCAN_19996 [Ancylostoma caninum]